MSTKRENFINLENIPEKEPLTIHVPIGTKDVIIRKTGRAKMSKDIRTYIFDKFFKN